MSIVIEKGVPVPSNRASGVTATFNAMEVGDSFTVPVGRRQTISSMFGRFKPKQFTLRTKGATTRIWRIA